VDRVAHGVPSELHEGRLDDGLEITKGGAESRKPDRQGLRKLQRGEQIAASSSRLQQADRSANSLPELSCEGRSAGRLSQGEGEETLQSVRHGISAEAQQKARDMQSRVSFGTWPHERNEAMDIWEQEPDVPRVARNVANRVNRLKGLGNAVVPQIPELLGRAILEAVA
jgi:hypothetical protein